MSIDLSRFYDSFFSESLDLLDEAESLFLAIEKGDHAENTLNAAFRCIHSIKGSAGSLGFDSIAEFSHEFETAMDCVRNGTVRIKRSSMDLLLAALDLLRVMLEAAKHDEPDIENARIGAISRQLAELTTSPASGGDTVWTASTRGVGISNSSTKQASQSITPSSNHFTISFRPLLSALERGHDPIRYLLALAQTGQARFTPSVGELPDCATFAPEQTYLAWRVELTSTQSRQQLVELFDWIADDCEFSITENEAASSPAKALLADTCDLLDTSRLTTLNSPSTTGAASIHVKSEKLDDLMNLLGEMLIAQSRVRALSEADERQTSDPMRAQLAILDRHTSALQAVILSIRLIPVSALFARFERLVRDAAQALGKQVRFVSDSRGTELDNGLVERLIDPLTHLIRNAIDHGVESQDERISHGKPAVATIELSATHRGGKVLIELRDDGRGIDVARIKARAIERGLVSAYESKTDQEWTRYIFQPGFSTAAKISTWSGRGVGLDAALSAVQSVGGQMAVRSDTGLGTTFSITLPLTTSILDGLVVVSAGQRYVIPLSAVDRCISFDRTQVRTMSSGAQAYCLDKRFIPFAELAAVLDESPRTSQAAQHSVAILAHVDEEPFILLVDTIEAQVEVVVKRLQHHALCSPLTLGATVLDSGQIALILDVTAVHAAFEREYGATPQDLEPESSHA